ncbi:hypothetical protein AB0I28_16520 [Phytomonospora sp. NPDC050363]|uniref:hypothetical protein n=1 Tax=Phytomonospora sp. NPDC050363 TaxID=3155642 RepID=UPI00340E20A9
MKKHQTDTVSLVFAVIFLGVVCWWLTSRFTEISAPGFGLMVAGTLIAAGLIGLVSALRPRKKTPVAPVATPGLFESAPTATTAEHIASEPTVEDAEPLTGLSGLDLHRRLSREERDRADELIRKIEESRLETRPTVEMPLPESPVTPTKRLTEGDTPEETGDPKSGG